LPLRNAKSPGRYLYAAIEHGYGAPRGAANSVRPTHTTSPGSAGAPIKATDEPD
jgi:hypothetical protein